MSQIIPSEVRWVLSTLNAAGFEAYAVGGCVRDCLRGVSPQDWDLCTAALPQEIRSCFPGVPLLETGIKHGTVTLRLDKGQYEVTTYRADGPYSDGRRPDRVVFVPDLEQDLARRDFTVNAMAMDIRGEVRDPFGGRADLENKLLRCVGDPDRRFREDGLRLMRCLRFSATLGYAIEPTTAAALERNLTMLDHVAAERIQTELRKLLLGPGCVDVLRAHPAVFCRFWPELAALVALEQHNPWHRWGGWEHTLHALSSAPEDLSVRLAVLLHDIGKPSCKTTDENGVDHFYGHAKAGAALAEEMLRALKFDNATRERVVVLVERHDAPIEATERSVRRWLGRLGQEALFHLLEVKRCDALGQGHDQVPQRLAHIGQLKAIAQAIIAQGQCFSLRDLAVRGGDLLAAGVPAGPAVGRALQGLLDQVIAGTLPNEKAALLAALKTQK